MTAHEVVHAGSRLSEEDLYLFNEGTHCRLSEKLGSHLGDAEGREGASFAVWAPNAEGVSVIGDFNEWAAGRHPLRRRGDSGIWEGFITGVGRGSLYKYAVVQAGGATVDKADPFAVHCEQPPRTASVVWDLAHDWGDSDWLRGRGRRNALDAPLSIYEVHLGSWRRIPEEGNRSLTYREIAPVLADHVRDLGFTHVELLPVMEHPFYGSWGYQVTGFFAPTSRYGTPQDFMFLVDYLHQAGLGVILDWVPSHFPDDPHGLSRFDGTQLYEHADPRQGLHPEWNSLIFNYGRHEVRSFLLSSACFWLDRFHADGLRVDAVASMLYLDYAREDGDWIPNRDGGRENLEALEFLRRLNDEVASTRPDVQVIAEESTSWPHVTRPARSGGLGFGLKWDMGWMHDTLKYLARDPVHRRWHHEELTFRSMYAFDESFVLPLSHDEVVHGKRSLLGKMPGDAWQAMAHLRLLLGLLFAQPGKKLLFMGAELGQWTEWNHDASLDWHLLEEEAHGRLCDWVRVLNRLHVSQPALHELDCRPEGFAWVDAQNEEQSVACFLRRGRKREDDLLVTCNFTPVPREGYRVGVPSAGRWRELLTSDAREFGGSGLVLPHGCADSEPGTWQEQPHSVVLTLPPLGITFLRRDAGSP